MRVISDHTLMRILPVELTVNRLVSMSDTTPSEQSAFNMFMMHSSQTKFRTTSVHCVFFLVESEAPACTSGHHLDIRCGCVAYPQQYSHTIQNHTGLALVRCRQSSVH